MDQAEDLVFDLCGGIGRITFNRPQARNAFTFAMYERLAGICAQANEDRSIKVLVLQGAGDKVRHEWRPAETVQAVGYDTPIVGWRGRHVNTLRLWSARAPDPLNLDTFNAGDYIGALADRVRAEAISKVLYPSDATPAGQELRLRQEYFFASASLLDLVRRHLKQHREIRSLGDHVAIQLNDTHPAISIAELMRILVDLNGVDWDEAWAITKAVFSYTNHTLLP